MFENLLTSKVLLLGAALAVIGFAVRAVPAADEPDDDERAYQTAVAQQALRDNCLICHTDGLITSQRLTPAQWKAEVEKMVGWGAPLPKEQAQLLIDFLAREYSDKLPTAPLVRLTDDQVAGILHPKAPAGVAVDGDAKRGAAPYATHCASCHGNDGLGAELGPNLVEKPVLLKPDEFRAITEQGRHRMPAFQKLLSRQVQDDILAWLRKRRFTLAVPK